MPKYASVDFRRSDFGPCSIQRILLSSMIACRLIITTCTTLCAIAANASAQTPLPGEQDHSTRDVDTSMNHPVDPKVADRGVLTMAGRQMPYELAMPQGFDRVYSVPGQAGMFYRANGGLYLVFDQGEYKQDKKGKEYAMVPAGAVFYIGKPDWSRIVPKSKVAASAINSQQEIRAKAQLNSSNTAKLATLSDTGTVSNTGKRMDEVDPTSLAVEAESDLVVRARIGTELPQVVGSEVGYGSGYARSIAKTNSAATTSDETDASETDAMGDSNSNEFQSKSPDAAAWAGTLPGGVDRSFLVGKGADVRPRILVDFIYRQERLSKLFLRAASSSQQK
ncbi:MAG: hypothetical protein RLZZ386_347 [Planctomycetota bacterium]|jgi:hypothetical protein